MINVLLAIMIIVSFLLSIAIHEYGHAQMAVWLGDRTPRDEGRQSLSLRQHIDPVGLLMCFILAFQVGIPAGFGWGKPVKADPWKMRVGANTGLLMVAVAGPLLNLIVGLLVALLLHFVGSYLGANIYEVRLFQFLIVFASVNICLTIFNIVPLYPLDCYQIVYILLPSKQALQFSKSGQYGPFIILIIFFFLPFLARLSGLGGLPIFQLPYYILLGALYLISLVVGGPSPAIFFLVSRLYNL
jgi:Zn-dependent protease